LRYSYFAGALFLVVDRNRKLPALSILSGLAQPAYVLQRRDGTYLCGFCSLQNGTLILRSSFAGQPKLLGSVIVWTQRWSVESSELFDD